LEDLLNKVAALKSLTGLQRPASSETRTPDAINTLITQLAHDVARDCGKQVAPSVGLGALGDLETGASDLVREIAVQLVRNAITHGVESPAGRHDAGKPEAGKLDVKLLRGETEWTLSVRDDGCGLSAPRIRRKLLELGWYTPEQLESFDDRQIVSHIFKPGFSTAGSVSMHAGRGVGLDVVQANVQKLGARLLLASTPGEYTEFKVRFAV